MLDLDENDVHSQEAPGLHNAMNRALPRQIRVWRWPSAFAALSVFGLLSALLGQGGIWWVLSWIALAIPIGVIAYFSCLGRTRPDR